ncbi:hypothetical protein ABZ864_47990 [Streptomyces sp. NPDC047082]|uniref:hypothetical protein n=1 Tax=Streptomyces sp. NPDC047082 TaxID=3155259 RepID=UPI0033DE965B
MDEPGRYHVRLMARGRTLMHGWWGDLPTAELKFRSWIGTHGSLDGAAIVLSEHAEADELMVARWLGEAGR